MKRLECTALFVPEPVPDSGPVPVARARARRRTIGHGQRATGTGPESGTGTGSGSGTNRKDAGFTIIEVVVAMGLFLIGISCILGLLAFGATLTRTAALRTEAAAAAEAVLADLEERLFPLVEEDGQLVAGAPAPIVDRPLPSRPDVVYSATPVPNPAGVAHPGETLEYRVDVVVAWTSGGVRRTRAFSALLLRQVPFGERLRRQFVVESP